MKKYCNRVSILGWFCAAIILSGSQAMGGGIGDSAPMELTIYYQQLQAHMEPVLDAFKRKHPNVNLKSFRATTEEMVATMEMEIRARNPQFDVAVAGNAALLGLQRDYDPFESYAPTERAAIMEGLLDPANIQTPFGTVFYIIAYNTKLVSQAGAPKTWAELLDTKWANKLTLADPKSSGSIYSFIWFIVEHMREAPYGWNYFENIAKLKPYYAPSHGNIAELLSLGERSIAIQMMSALMGSMEKGDPVSWVFPSDGIPSELNVTVIRKGTPNLRAAQLWVDFLLSKEGQRLVGDYLRYIPVRKDLEYKFKNGVELSEIKLIGRDVNWIADNKEDILEKFRLIGASR